MASPRILLLLAGLAACRHVPPDKAARAVEQARPVRTTPGAADLRGSWCSVELRGTLSELGHSVVYVFGADGAYSGAVVSEAQALPIEGRYTYRAGVLDLDDGAVEFRASSVGGQLELVSTDSYARLVPLRSRGQAPPSR